jgi:hypothetical protein
MAATPQVPTKTLEFLEWAQAHSSRWASQAANIGISPAQATAYTALYTTAMNNYTAQQAAKAAAIAATRVADASEASLRELTSAYIAVIKGYALTNKDPIGVYNAADIRPPTPPSPQAAPGTPQKFTATLLPTGAIKLTWKSDNNGSGTVTYKIERKLGAGNFADLGNQGKKSFTDDNIPRGTSTIEYRVTAQRGTSLSQPAQYTVVFGTIGTQLAITGQYESPRLAA